MLTEWIAKENKVKYLTIILREFDWEADQQTDGRNVYKQILVSAKLQIGKRGQKIADWGSPYGKWRSALDCDAIKEEEAIKYNVSQWSWSPTTLVSRQKPGSHSPLLPFTAPLTVPICRTVPSLTALLSNPYTKCSNSLVERK